MSGSLQSCTPEDWAIWPRILAVYHAHLLTSGKAQGTARSYVNLLRKVVNEDGLAPESVATEEYLTDYVKPRRNNEMAASVKNFGAFWAESRPAEWPDLSPEDSTNRLFQAMQAAGTEGAAAKPESKRKRKSDATALDLSSTGDVAEGGDANADVQGSGKAEPEARKKSKKSSKAENEMADPEAEAAAAEDLECESEDEGDELEFPFYTYYETRGVLGEDLNEIPAHWPPGIAIAPGRWNSWLPKDWGQGKKETSGLTVFIGPDGKVCHSRAEVARNVDQPLNEEKLPTWPLHLPRDWGISWKVQNANNKAIWIYPDGSSFVWNLAGLQSALARRGKQKNKGIKTPKVKLSDEQLERLRAARRRLIAEGQEVSDMILEEPRANGSRMEAPSGFSFEQSGESQWAVLPEDVTSISVDVFSKHFQNAGWSVTSESAEQHTFTGQVDLTLCRSGGKLLIRSGERSVARGVAQRYVDWLDNEP